jgi:hypothetical protein
MAWPALAADDNDGRGGRAAKGCAPLTGRQALAQLSMEEVDVWHNILLLCVHIFVYRVIAYLGLHFCW